jgi:membrane protease YdiL (CAAX protease family)
MRADLDRFGAEVRRLSPSVLALALVVHIALSAFVNLAVFAGPKDSPFAHWLDLPKQWGRGLVSGTLLANLGLLLVVGGLVLVGLGRARATDLGLRRRDVLPALITGVLVWALLQACAAIVAACDQGIHLAAGFATAAAARRSVGEFLGQLFGNALYEEVLFRGVLLTQGILAGRAAGRTEGQAQRRALLWSQAAFALQHVPNRLAHGAWHSPGDAALDLALLFVSGLFFAAVYLRTRNLLLVVVLHALGNTPMLLLAAHAWLHGLVLLGVFVALLICGPRWLCRSRP